MVGLFTADAILLNAGEPALVGTAAIRADFAAGWAGSDAVESSSIDEVQVAGNWAFARGTSIIQTTSDSGEITVEIGRWVSIFNKTPGGGRKSGGGVPDQSQGHKVHSGPGCRFYR